MCARALRGGARHLFDTCKASSYCTRVKSLVQEGERMVWRSTSEPIETGDATLHESILATAAAMGDRVALVDGPSGAAVTYGRSPPASSARRPASRRAGWVRATCSPSGRPTRPSGPSPPSGPWRPAPRSAGASPVATERELAAQAMDCEASILATVPARLPAAREVARDGRRARGRGARRRRGRGPGAGGRARPARAPSRCCPTRAARPACPRASCSPTPTSWPPWARRAPR